MTLFKRCQKRSITIWYFFISFVPGDVAVALYWPQPFASPFDFLLSGKVFLAFPSYSPFMRLIFFNWCDWLYLHSYNIDDCDIASSWSPSSFFRVSNYCVFYSQPNSPTSMLGCCMKEQSPPIASPACPLQPAHHLLGSEHSLRLGLSSNMLSDLTWAQTCSQTLLEHKHA